MCFAFLAWPKCHLVLQPMSSMLLGTATNVIYVTSYCNQCCLSCFILGPKKQHCHLCCFVLRPKKPHYCLCRFVLRPKKWHCRFVLWPKNQHCCLCCLVVWPQKQHWYFKLQPKKRMSLQTTTTETHTFNNNEIVAHVGFSEHCS